MKCKNCEHEIIKIRSNPDFYEHGKTQKLTVELKDGELYSYIGCIHADPIGNGLVVFCGCNNPERDSKESD